MQLALDSRRYDVKYMLRISEQPVGYQGYVKFYCDTLSEVTFLQYLQQSEKPLHLYE